LAIARRRADRAEAAYELGAGDNQDIQRANSRRPADVVEPIALLDTSQENDQGIQLPPAYGTLVHYPEPAPESFIEGQCNSNQQPTINPSVPSQFGNNRGSGSLFEPLGRSSQGYASIRSEPSRLELPGENTAVRQSPSGYGYGGGLFELGTGSIRMGAASYGYGAQSNHVLELGAAQSRAADYRRQHLRGSRERHL